MLFSNLVHPPSLALTKDGDDDDSDYGDATKDNQRREFKREESL